MCMWENLIVHGVNDLVRKYCKQPEVEIYRNK